jgi:hypothetical protein
MAKGTESSIYVDEFLFDAYTSQIDMNITVDSGETDNLASDAHEYIPLLSSMEITQNGYMEGFDAGDFQAELHDRLATTGVVVTLLFGTADTDCPAYIIPNSFASAMEFSSPTNGVMTLNGTWAQSNQGRRGIRIYSGTISATEDQTPVDLGAAGTDGGLFVLHVTTITGSATDAVLKLQSCATVDGSYDDEATITFSDVDGYTETMSGTVNRYVQLTCTDLGGATSFAVVAIACVNGVTM